MDLPVVLIITSNKCSACLQMKGSETGKPENISSKKTINRIHGWDLVFFKKLLTANIEDNIQKFRVFEINFKSLSPSDITDVNYLVQFNLVNGNVERTVLTKGKKQNEIKILKEENNRKIESNKIPGNYEDLIRSLIPEKIVPNYLYLYPSWAYFNAKIWNDAVTKKSVLFGVVNSCSIIYESNEYRINTREEPSRSQDPLEIANKIIIGQLSLLPQAIERPQTEESKFIEVHSTCRDIGFKLFPLK